MTAIVAERFSDPSWIFEPKLDGMRCLVYRHGDQVRLLSRNRRRMNERFPEIADSVSSRAAADVVLDCEVVAIEGGRPSFGALQARAQRPAPVLLYVFDVLHLDGRSTRELPLVERKELLPAAIDVGEHVRLVPHRAGDGHGLFTELCSLGWEGVVAKRAASPYTSARSSDWRKLRCTLRQELVIGGFTDPSGERRGLGALLVGYFDDDGRLHYAGKVGSGFDQQLLVALRRVLGEMEIAASPFGVAGAPAAGAHWVAPTLVCEVAFAAWTAAGLLRHARFIGMRSDKPARAVRRETSAR